jgi:lipopolysaccharide export system protein LptA
MHKTGRNSPSGTPARLRERGWAHAVVGVWLVVWLSLFGVTPLTQAAPGQTSQPSLAGKVKNFKVSPESYPAPHQQQMKSLLRGTEAEPQSNNRILVREATLETFRENGERELLIQAPECLYDPAQHSASSAGRLRVQTAEGKFSIEGQGFWWQQTNSSLSISNNVHTVIHPELLSGQAVQTNAQGEAGLELYSERFDYKGISGLGEYGGHVRVNGTNLDLTAGRLLFLVPMNRGLSPTGVREITAEQEVTADFAEVQPDGRRTSVHATGERAVYSVASNIVHVSGQPAWKSEQREGRGDELVIDRTNRIFQASGHAWLKLPSQSLGGSALFPHLEVSSTNSAAATNQFIEVYADNYELRTNWAVFQKDVKVNKLVGGQPRGTLRCSTMTVAFSGTNQIQTLLAEERVSLELEDKQFTAGKAWFTGTNGNLELTQNPAWRAGSRTGSGTTIEVNVQQNEMMVKDNALMRWPAGELALSRAVGPVRTNSASPKPPVAAQFAEITSNQYRVTPTNAIFLGKVRVEHPQMQFDCEKITTEFPSSGGKVERLLAEQAVVFELTDERGQKAHGKAEQALYTYHISGTVTNEQLELTGNPSLESTNGIFRNRVIIYDLMNQKIFTRGKYKASGMASGIDTNKFRFPENKSAK